MAPERPRAPLRTRLGAAPGGNASPSPPAELALAGPGCEAPSDDNGGTPLKLTRFALAGPAAPRQTFGSRTARMDPPVGGLVSRCPKPPLPAAAAAATPSRLPPLNWPAGSIPPSRPSPSWYRRTAGVQNTSGDTASGFRVTPPSKSMLAKFAISRKFSR